MHYDVLFCFIEFGLSFVYDTTLDEFVQKKREGLGYGYIVPIHLFISAYSAIVAPLDVAVRDDRCDSSRQ